LQEYWENHPELQGVPIYFASQIMGRCLPIYKTYIYMMNRAIQTAFEVSNPWEFKHIHNLRSLQEFEDVGPCVVMASPGMLQSGVSRSLFEMWCSNKRNGVVMCGYTVEGTLAHHILNEPKEILKQDGSTVPCNLQIYAGISFSAHSDFAQTSEFISAVKPKHIVLVHGDLREMTKLKNQLELFYKGEDVHCHSPANAVPMYIDFTGQKVAKVVGSMAEEKPVDGEAMSGLLLQKDFQTKLVSPAELHDYSGLNVGEIEQNLEVPYSQSWATLCHYIGDMFDQPLPGAQEDDTVSVLGVVAVKKLPGAKAVSFVWSADPVRDMIADSMVCLVQQIEENPTMFPGAGADSKKALAWKDTVVAVLSEQYGPAAREGETITLDVDGEQVSVQCLEGSEGRGHVEVTCGDEALKARIDASMQNAGLVLQTAKMPQLKTQEQVSFVKAETLHPE